jgi:hypothetical protein
MTTQQFVIRYVTFLKRMDTAFFLALMFWIQMMSSNYART